MRRYGTSQAVVAHRELAQVGEVAQFCGYVVAQFVGSQVQVVQVVESAECCRYGTAELVAAEVQFVQVFKIAKLRRNAAGEIVVREQQDTERGKAAQFCGYGAGQFVSAQVQPFEMGEVLKLGGNLAGQVVCDEVDLGYAAFAVGLNALPFGEGGVREPVVLARPACAAGGFVERFEGVEFRAAECDGEVSGMVASECCNLDCVSAGLERFAEAGVFADVVVYIDYGFAFVVE